MPSDTTAARARWRILSAVERLNASALDRLDWLAMAEIDLTRRIVYRPEREAPMSVRRGLHYGSDAAPELLMDIYTPPAALDLPAVLFVHGGPISRDMMPPS